MKSTNACSVTEEIAGYLLRCVLSAGHPGEHWAADLEPVGEAS